MIWCTYMSLLLIGLNTSYMIYGPMGSFLSSHIEGGGYCFTNMIINQDGQKFWLGLNRTSTKLLMEEIAQFELQTSKCRRARDVKKKGKKRPCEACACEKSALHGPGYFLTPFIE